MLQKYLYYNSIMPDAPATALNYAQNDAGILADLNPPRIGPPLQIR